MAYQFSNFHKENIHVKNLQVKINKPYCHCKKGLVPAMLAMASYTGPFTLIHIQLPYCVFSYLTCQIPQHVCFGAQLPLPLHICIEFLVFF